MSNDKLGCTIFAIAAVILAISTFNVFDKQEKFSEVEDEKVFVRNSPGPSFQSTVKLEEFQNSVVMNVGTSVDSVNNIGTQYYLNLQNYLNPSIQNLELAQNISAHSIQAGAPLRGAASQYSNKNGLKNFFQK